MRRRARVRGGRAVNWAGLEAVVLPAGARNLVRAAGARTEVDEE